MPKQTVATIGRIEIAQIVEIDGCFETQFVFHRGANNRHPTLDRAKHWVEQRYRRYLPVEYQTRNRMDP